MTKPRLTNEQILAWADAHHKRTGCWPTSRSGSIQGTMDENWRAVTTCLYFGYRGLTRRSSLRKLLLKQRGKSAKLRRPALTIQQILAWADAHHERTGKWPTNRSDRIQGTKDETWHGVAACLYAGNRGLPRRVSLNKLFVKYRGKSVQSQRPVLRIQQILAWADAYHERSGHWPTSQSGPIDGTSDETWHSVTASLCAGSRGLPCGLSLRKLLVKRRGAQFPKARPSLTIPQILAWADEHHQRTGKWPGVYAGRVGAAPDENWLAINQALRRGQRGLPAGKNLFLLLAEQRGERAYLLRTALATSWQARSRRSPRARTAGLASGFAASRGLWRRRESRPM